MSGELCEELIAEIFTRLPPKSLLRFRLLSKSLCSCIHSPDFIRMHTSRSPQKVLISHALNDDKLDYYTFTLHSEDQLPVLTRRGSYNGITAYDTCCVSAGSCNGILCLVDRKEYNIILWNPTIRRELTLPRCPGSNASFCRCLYPYECWVGFGFDPVTDDYKIVSLPEKGGTGETSYVYTIKTGAWCAIASPTPSFFGVFSRGYIVNGALHWMACDISTNYILTFNLSTHVFGMIELPALGWEENQVAGQVKTVDWDYEVLTTIQGSLAVLCFNRSDLWIWAMRQHDNPSSWSVVFKAKENEVAGQVETVLQPTNNGDLLNFWSFWGFDVYDLKIGARLRVGNMDALTDIFNMETFVESLQLFDVGTSCENGSKQSILDGNWRSKRTGVIK